METSGRSVWSVWCCLCGTVTCSAQWFGYLWKKEHMSISSALKMELCPLLFSQENILAAGPQKKDESMIYHGTRQMAFLSTAGGFTSFGTWSVMVARSSTNVSIASFIRFYIYAPVCNISRTTCQIQLKVTSQFLTRQRVCSTALS